MSYRLNFSFSIVKLPDFAMKEFNLRVAIFPLVPIELSSISLFKEKKNCADGVGKSVLPLIENPSTEKIGNSFTLWRFPRRGKSTSSVPFTREPELLAECILPNQSLNKLVDSAIPPKE